MKFKRFITTITTLAIAIPNFVFAQVTPVTFNDSELSKVWYLNTLKMSQVWGYSQGEGQIVAVLDAGVDIDHPDLINNIWKNTREIPGDNMDNDMNGFVDDVNGWDFVNNDNNVKPDGDKSCIDAEVCPLSAYYHGTLISGLIAAQANNNFGTAGIAPKAQIMPLRVLTTTGEGSSSDVVKAIDYAVNNGASVINMSFVGPQNDPNLVSAIERAYLAGRVVVIAGGNEETEGFPLNLTSEPRYPVCNFGSNGQKISLGVGSHNEQYKLSDFSNRGVCLDLLAPGENIYGLVNNEPAVGLNNYFSGGFKGTSLSTPLISATVALIRSYKGGLTPTDIFNLIRNNAQDISAQNPSTKTQIGKGALNIMNIFQAIGGQVTQPSATDTQPPIVESQASNLPILAGKVVTTDASPAVYYVGNNSKRYVFPNSGTFLSWYPDFSNVIRISSDDMAKFSLGGIVTYRPGVNLLKIESDPKVYAVDKKGTLRWIQTEAAAISLYGQSWSSKVKDLPVSFFINYIQGADILSSLDYDLAKVLNASTSINIDKGL